MSLLCIWTKHSFEILFRLASVASFQRCWRSIRCHQLFIDAGMIRIFTFPRKKETHGTVVLPPFCWGHEPIIYVKTRILHLWHLIHFGYYVSGDDIAIAGPIVWVSWWLVLFIGRLYLLLLFIMAVAPWWTWPIQKSWTPICSHSWWYSMRFAMCINMSSSTIINVLLNYRIVHSTAHFWACIRNEKETSHSNSKNHRVRTWACGTSIPSS
jgi:hypothetical protein